MKSYGKLEMPSGTTPSDLGINDDVVLLTTDQTISGAKTFGSQILSTVSTGTSPFSIASTTKVANLNVDLLDGEEGADFHDLSKATGLLSILKGGTGLSSLGSANQLLGVNSGASASEYKSLTGTSNQITVNHSANSISLSLPQDIHTAAAPTFASITTTSDATIGGNLSVTGNFTVNGTTITVNSTTVSVDDPIFTLGGDTAPSVDDNKDRGIEFRWYNGSTAKRGFFGFDDSTGYFTFIPDAANTSEVFSGTAGDIQASNFRGDLIGTVQTASQPNITSLGTLTSLTTSGALTASTTLSNVIVSRATTSVEGGQLVLAYGNNTTCAGEGVSTWNIDVANSMLRVFRRNASDVAATYLTITESGATTADGTWTFNNAINAYAGIYRTTGNGTAYWLQQDGTGRQHWYWNTAGGLSPTFINAGEDASDIMMSITNDGSGPYFLFRSASGYGKNAGDAITWNTLLYVHSSSLQYNGYNVYHTGYDTGILAFRTAYREHRAKIEWAGTSEWRKIATVVESNSAYASTRFKVEIWDPRANFGINFAETDKYVYYVTTCRSDSTTLNSPDTGFVVGPNSTYCRLVKQSTGNYEIQIGTPAVWREFHVSIQVVAANNSSTISYLDGTSAGDTTGTIYTATDTDATVHLNNISGRQIISRLATGAAPLVVSSTTLVANLNADLLDGYHVGASGSTIPLLSTSNTWSGAQSISNSTASTSTGTGALTVSGGVGVGENLFVGGNTTATNVNVTTGGAYQVNGTAVLNATTLGSGVTASSLTSVGVLTSLTTSGLIATNAAAPTLASASTIAPTKIISFVSGTTQISTITAPSLISSGGGVIVLIPTGLWSTSTSGNIALATTAVVNKALIMTYDTTTAKWYPSY